MRIPWAKWLTAAWLVGAAQAQAQQQTLHFINEDFGAEAIFPVDRSSVKSFSWSVPSNTPATRVLLHSNDKAGADVVLANSSTSSPQQAPISSASPNPKDGGGGAHPGEKRAILRIETPLDQEHGLSTLNSDSSTMSGEINTVVSLQANSSSVTILDTRSLSEYYAQQMYWEVAWGEGGKTFSRYFTIVPSEADVEAVNKTNSNFNNSSPAHADHVPTPPSEGGSYGGPEGSSPSGGSGSQSSGGGGGTLSGGAIAGIVVAAVVVFAVFSGILAWFLIRRRRRSRAQDGASGTALAPYGKDRNGTQEAVAEKEANGAADGSPISPYSDDGAAAAVASGSAAAVIHTPQPGHASVAPGPGAPQERSLSPYSDRQRQDSDSPAGGRDAVQTPYRHLVEEGMTEEDIRRLELEERELDQAIEQAGRADGEPHSPDHR